ncbi:ABC transporter permease [Millisia brevis]|uniref:ABC transporter permease n=1 Tax=Millisia brevis TaxID=264148 RepID=UPI000829EBD4|nr:ABC transporter permease [Millisia brevis]
MSATAELMRQTGVFTVREAIKARAMIGESIGIAVAAPTVFLAGFLVTQRKIMDAQGIDYVQFLPVWVLVQVLMFLGINAATRVAQDASSGMLRRIESLPVYALAPALGRTIIQLAHAVPAIAVLLGVAYAFGFRLRGDPIDTALFLIIALFTAAVIYTLFDAVALLLGSPDAVSPVLTLPMLIFSLMSTGLVPAERFPSAVSWFVEHQPVSRIIDALRDLAAGTAGSSVTTAFAWLIGLAVVALAVSGLTLRRGR